MARMQIALIAPTPVPFVWGGAENLYASLQRYINEETLHACEIIKIPTRENDLVSLLKSYQLFLEADVSHFDLLVSTKYPSWMASNDRHVCYMLHKLRGLYDTYHFTREPTDVTDVSASLMKSVEKFASSVSRSKSSISEAGDFIEKVLLEAEAAPDDPQFRFPGPLSRRVIHLLDDWGLNRRRVSRYAAISRNVAGRAGYFPEGSTVHAVYPPPRMAGYRCGSDDYFFTMSRLDHPKRVDLLISAVREMRDPVPLVIAGTGPDEDRLRAIAGDDPNIRFVGAVDDAEALELYANALAVPFIPYDEDYGYITVEAMLSGKPVITSTDAGGPLEFVLNGNTGLVCPPTVEALAQQFEYAASHRAEMRYMGRNGRQIVKSIHWSNFVDKLVDPLDPSNRTKKRTGAAIDNENIREKLVVVSTFPAFPARGGGQARILNLYRSLAVKYDIELVCLSSADQEPESTLIAPNFRQTKVPISQAFIESEIEMSRSVDWVAVTDIAAIDGWKLIPDYIEAVASAAKGARAIVVSHPFLLRCVEAVAGHPPIWFEAHNVEAPMKQDMLPDNQAARALVRAVEGVERDCWERAEIAFACTAGDIDAMSDRYGHRSGGTFVVPNGVDPSVSPFVAPSQRRALRERYSLPIGSTALFVGSWHGPNIDAARTVLDIAKDLSSIDFLIVGSVCMAIRDDDIPKNVKLLGVLDDEVKSLVSGVCDIALNPMQSGSGSNLKMFDYFSSGLPVISTDFGARGITNVQEEPSYLSSEISLFGINVVKLLADLPLRERLARNARLLVEREFAWDVIGGAFLNSINHCGRSL